MLMPSRPPNVFETRGVSGRGLNTARTTSNASALMISPVFWDVFMSLKGTADRSGGRATDSVAVYQSIGDTGSLVCLQIVMALQPVTRARMLG